LEVCDYWIMLGDLDRLRETRGVSDKNFHCRDFMKVRFFESSELELLNL
jgi:hypothetical protein